MNSWIEIALAQVRAGDVAGAKRSLDHGYAAAERASSLVYQSEAFRELAMVHAQTGDFRGAIERVNKGRNPSFPKVFQLAAIAAVQADAGADAAGRQTIAQALEVVRVIMANANPSDFCFYKSKSIAEIAFAQMRLGDKVAAKETIGLALAKRCYDVELLARVAQVLVTEKSKATKAPE
jgi:hypothetical protein